MQLKRCSKDGPSLRVGRAFAVSFFCLLRRTPAGPPRSSRSRWSSRVTSSDRTDLLPVHDIAFASADVFSALQEFSVALARHGGAVKGLSMRETEGRHAVRARIEGLAPETARALTDNLAARPDVSHAAVEHIIWRRPA
jgi:hypothetical protein